MRTVCILKYAKSLSGDRILISAVALGCVTVAHPGSGTHLCETGHCCEHVISPYPVSAPTIPSLLSCFPTTCPLSCSLARHMRVGELGTEGYSIHNGYDVVGDGIFIRLAKFTLLPPEKVFQFRIYIMFEKDVARGGGHSGTEGAAP